MDNDVGPKSLEINEVSEIPEFILVEQLAETKNAHQSSDVDATIVPVEENVVSDKNNTRNIYQADENVIPVIIGNLNSN